MTALAIFRAALALAHIVASYLRERQLMDAGEAKATAKSLAALSQRLGISNAVVAEVEALSDADLDAELRGDR